MKALFPGYVRSISDGKEIHPCSMLGGIFGLLAFEADYVGALIEQGFQDAVTHDCDKSGCIFPTYGDVTAAARATRKTMVRTGAA